MPWPICLALAVLQGGEPLQDAAALRIGGERIAPLSVSAEFGRALAVGDRLVAVTGSSGLEAVEQRAGRLTRRWVVADPCPAFCVASCGEDVFAGNPFAARGPSSRGEVWVYAVGDDVHLKQVLFPPVDKGLFGSCLDASEDRLAVGQMGSGVVWIYERRRAAWELAAKVSRDGTPGFGLACALEGDTLAVYEQAAAEDSGEGYVHFYALQADGPWTAAGTVGPLGDAEVGSAAQLDMRDGTLVAGMPCHAGGAGQAYVLECCEREWSVAFHAVGTTRTFGSAVAVGQGLVAVGDTSLNQERGGVVLYQRDAGTWSACAVLEDGASGSLRGFGSSLGITPSSLLVGAPYADAKGACWIYALDRIGKR